MNNAPHKRDRFKTSEWKSWLRWLLLAVATIVVYKSFDRVSDLFSVLRSFVSILTPFTIAFVVAYFLDKPVIALTPVFENIKTKRTDFFKKHSRGLSVAVVYIIFICVLVLLGMAIIPALIKGLSSLFGNYQVYIDTTRDFFNDITEKFPVLGDIALGEQMLEWMRRFAESIDISTITSSLESVISVGSTLSSILVGLFISIYMLLEKKQLLSTLRRFCTLFMQERTIRSVALWCKRADRVVFRYFVTQLFDCVIVSIMATIALAVMKAPSPVLLGFIFGMFNIIPYFGPIIGGVLVVLIIVFTKGFTFALWATIILLALQQIDANVINPRILGQSLDMSPFWVIFAVTFGGGVFGFAGMLLSVPVFAVCRMLYHELFSLKKYREAVSAPNSECDSDTNKLEV